MTDGTAAGYDGKSEDPYYWRFMNDKEINKGVEEMVKEIHETEDQLKKLVSDNAYEKTQTYIQHLSFMVLGADGFIHKLYQRNKDMFPEKGGKPDWYAAMSAEDKYIYGECEKHFAWLPMMDKACMEASHVIMHLNLLQGFRILSIRENLTDCDLFTHDDYKQIVEDALEVGRIITTDWDVMERKAGNAEEFYRRNLGKMDRYKLNTRYREERTKAYIAFVSDHEIQKRMRVDSRGNYSPNPYNLTMMEILDTYMGKVSELYKAGIEDRTNKALEEVISYDVKTLTHLSKEMNDLAFYPVVAALKALIKACKDFVQDVWNTFDGFKKASDGSPYCFLQKLPVSSIKKAYSYSVSSRTPLESGTEFQALYSSMAGALTAHCIDFVYNHGHQELK